MGSSVVNNLPVNAGDADDVGLIPGSRRKWWRKWQPISVFSPGKSHGQCVCVQAL